MICFLDRTGGGRIGATKLTPGYWGGLNGAGGLTRDLWNFGALFSYDEDAEVQLQDMQSALH